MILNILKSASDAMQKSNEIQNSNIQKENYKNLLGNVKKNIYELEKLLDIAEYLEQNWTSVKFLTKNIKEDLHNTIDSCGDKINDMGLDNSSVEVFTNTIRNSRSSVEVLWKQAAEQKYGQMSAQLKQLNYLIQDRITMLQVCESLDRSTVQLPDVPRIIQIYEENYKKGQKLIDSINLSDDPHIVTFIEKTRNNQATLKDLTVDVFKWLLENNYADKFSVKFGK